MNKKLLKVGIVGTLLSALCCFTPIVVVVFSLVGLGSALAWLDSILLPTLVFFIGVSIYALTLKNKAKTPSA